ncbi:MAG: argininosuccinate lyase [Candidatus Gracilibacteria bacterium]|nr:argininosuccinate lyase [Candidatus Gracilibacteria bacterium]
MPAKKKTSPKSQKHITKKLWFKKGLVKLDPVVEEFNAGDDIIYDQQLIPYDVQGSIAYSKMLKKHGIITAEEQQKLETGLKEIKRLWEKGEFVISLEDEDCHTAIENFLIGKYGDVGKKIHTARSRNDQVLVTVRLWVRDKLQELRKSALTLAAEITKTAKKYEFTPMPGFTHTQKAMPTTVGTWAAAYAESLVDNVILLDTVYQILDQNPLGSGAGYGSPFAFDREYLTKQLGMRKTQNNVHYCHTTRLSLDSMAVEAALQIMLTLNKLASDLILFSSAQYGFFDFDQSIATGSSIMPQKKNLDVAELVRARTATVVACKSELVMNHINKISGYHRDGQELKRPLFLALRYTTSSLEVMRIIMQKITPNEEALLAAMTPELFATHRAFELVHDGMSFRDAYLKIKEGNIIDKIKVTKADIVRMLKMSKHQGGAGNLGLAKLAKEIEGLKGRKI